MSYECISFCHLPCHITISNIIQTAPPIHRTHTLSNWIRSATVYHHQQQHIWLVGKHEQWTTSK